MYLGVHYNRMAKDNQTKTRSTKKYRYTAAEVAELTNVSESYVKKLRSCDKLGNSPTARMVLVADQLLGDSSNKLLLEVDRVLNKKSA